MAGLYHIESQMVDHSTILRSAVMAWGEKEPDMYLVSSDGFKVYTRRILLSFYSKVVSDVLSNATGKIAGISVSASSSSLLMLIKVLTTGSVLSNSKQELLEVGKAAEALGIVLNEKQIGFRKDKSGEQDVDSRNTSKRSGRKVLKNMKYSGYDSSGGDEFADCSDMLEMSLLEGEDHLAKNKRTGLGQRNIRGPYKRKKLLYCEKCGKKYSSATGLRNHKLLHTGKVFFKCEFCAYTSVQKGNLKAHKLKNHRKKTYPEAVECSSVVGENAPDRTGKDMDDKGTNVAC